MKFFFLLGHVMQGLSVCQLCLQFPGIPGSSGQFRTADMFFVGLTSLFLKDWRTPGPIVSFPGFRSISFFRKHFFPLWSHHSHQNPIIVPFLEIPNHWKAQTPEIFQENLQADEIPISQFATCVSKASPRRIFSRQAIDALFRGVAGVARVTLFWGTSPKTILRYIISFFYLEGLGYIIYLILLRSQLIPGEHQLVATPKKIVQWLDYIRITIGKFLWKYSDSLLY